ncbi:biopolymer transporter ExbD [Roseivivax isoporae]|uniref:Biopolymer transporter ExbD n=1 Tax=Roseivivax isoporae LMG 25204 TaxID=1449351 RepID=X7FC98_9RHOB|nr:biopolymer transporter ExbD [Roseivivax isoporae LMG 25204]
MTSLIDVIFLLLLFFMLTSTFSKFSEVELTAAARASAGSSDAPPLFLQLGAEDVRLNGRDVAFDTLPDTLGSEVDPDAAGPRVLLIALRDGVSAQRLTDLLVQLRGVAGLTPTVVGAS